MWECLFGCISLGVFSEDKDSADDLLRVSMLTGGGPKEEDFVDYVQIGSKKELPGYEVEWRRATEILPGKVTLFDSYNPFSIRESNFVIKNQLIIFQCLSQQPWLLRKIIQADRSRNNFYNVFLQNKKVI